MGNLICWWKNHKFDIERYRRELQEYYRLDWGFKTMAEIHRHVNNPPKPYCLRCKKLIED
jgi:hypothetical protein